MRQANTELRALMREKKVPAWALALYFKCHENTVHARLRTELSEQEKARFEAAVPDIAAQEEEAENNV